MSSVELVPIESNGRINEQIWMYQKQKLLVLNLNL